MTIKLFTALVLAGTLQGAHFTYAQTAYAPAFEPAGCPFELPAGKVEGQSVECGYLIVPEDRDNPGGRSLRLTVAMFRHPAGATEPDPIVYLSGGPGASSLELLWASFAQAYSPVFAANRDIILFDQRGVGVSQPALDCPAFDELMLDLLDGDLNGRVLTGPEVVDLIMDTLRTCEDNLSNVARLSFYNTAANAADVNDLRVALGYERLNLWGGSYGTRLALGVMRDYPRAIRSVVLDSVYPPDIDLYVEAPGNIDRAFNTLFQACAADEACNRVYPDLRTVFFETVDRLNTNPVSIQLVDPLTGRVYDAVLSGTDLKGSLFQFLYSSELLRWLPRLIYDVSEGDFYLISQFRGLLLANQGLVSLGMQFSVQCNEEFSFSSVERLESALAVYPQMADLFENSFIGKLGYRVCEWWDSGRAAAIENQPVTSDIPTLLMAGDYDPITPPAWAERAARTLTKSSYFLYRATGHGASGSPCPRNMMVAFFNDPQSTPDGSCMDSMGIRFALPTEVVPFSLRLGQMVWFTPPPPY